MSQETSTNTENQSSDEAIIEINDINKSVPLKSSDVESRKNNGSPEENYEIIIVGTGIGGAPLI